VPIIAKAAVAAGADGVFLEFHPEPDKALCDGPSCLPLEAAPNLLGALQAYMRGRGVNASASARLSGQF
jgi:2-dehydro-3-deoxyphosphooctonate aldolase (KDO 8-P synthase)